MPTGEFSGRSSHHQRPHRRPVSLDGMSPGSSPRQISARDRPPRPVFRARRPGEPLVARPSEPITETEIASPQTRSPILSSVQPSVPAIETSAPEQHQLTDQPATTAKPPSPVAPALNFDPPTAKRTKRRKLPLVAICLFGLFAAALAVYGGLRWQAARADPAAAFNDALNHNLSLDHLAASVKEPNSTNQLLYDFTTPKNPIISAKATLGSSDNHFGVTAYSTLQNSYISYTKVPSTVSSDLAKITTGAWVQIRDSGQLPPAVSADLANLADPHYQAFGLAILGNYQPKTRQQLVDFLGEHHVFRYDKAAVTASTINGEKVLVYRTTVDANYLKVANQSAAASLGIPPSAVADASQQLDRFNGKVVQFFISASDHRLVRLNGDGYRADFSPTSDAPPNEPATKLTWADFASYQWKMASQAVQHSSGASLDAARRLKLTQLHRALASYFAQNGVYPTFTQLNDPVWSGRNLPGLDADSLRDPLADTITLATAPKTNVLAYIPVSVLNRLDCDATSLNPCVHYRLVATLSTKQQATVTDP